MANNITQQKKLITLDQACEFLSLKKSRIYYLVFHKKIPHYKIDKTLHFSPDDLTKWLESKRKM